MKKKIVELDTATGTHTQLAANETPWRTRNQIANHLQVSVGTVRNWTAAGKLPAITSPGRAVRYHLPSVEQALLRTQKEVA